MSTRGGAETAGRRGPAGSGVQRMENAYGRARRTAVARPAFVDLINTSFHACGLRYPPDLLGRWAAAFFADKAGSAYAPETAGSRQCREAVSRHYQSCGWHVDPARVLITASASESYSHVFAALCRPGGSVLLPRPGYPLFEEVAARAGLEVRFYDLDRTWAVDRAAVCGLIDGGTQAVVLISPNNPTGTIVPEETIREIATTCRRRGVVIVADEVFSEYRYGPAAAAPLPRPGRLDPQARVCTINGASKLFASPELKVSWVIVSGPSAWSKAAAERIETQNDLFLSASPLSQHLVSRMVDEGTGFTASVVAEVAARRQTMLDALEEEAASCGGALTWEEPTGGIHLPVRLALPPGSPDDERTAVSLLDEEDLAVHPGYLYGVENGTVLVLSFLARKPDIVEGIGRLGRWVRSRLGGQQGRR